MGEAQQFWQDAATSEGQGMASLQIVHTMLGMPLPLAIQPPPIPPPPPPPPPHTHTPELPLLQRQVDSQRRHRQPQLVQVLGLTHHQQQARREVDRKAARWATAAAAADASASAGAGAARATSLERWPRRADGCACGSIAGAGDGARGIR